MGTDHGALLHTKLRTKQQQSEKNILKND